MNEHRPASDCPQASWLGAYHDGELDARASADVEAHLGACPACAEEMARLVRVSQLLARAARPAPTAAQMARFHEAARDASSAGIRHWAEALTALAAAVLITFSAWLWRMPSAAASGGYPSSTWEVTALRGPSEQAPATDEDQLVEWQLQNLSSEGGHDPN